MLALLLFCCATLLLYKLTTWNFRHWKALAVVGPEPVPFFGNYFRLALNREYSAVTTLNIYNQYPNERYVGIYRFNVPILLLRDPEIIKNVLIKDFDTFQDRGVEFSKEGLGANLFHADGETWTVLRRKMSPLFTAARIKGMFHIVHDCADKFASFVAESGSGGKELDLLQLSARYTGELIGSCMFGVEIDALNTRPNKFLDTGNKSFTPSWRLMLDLMFPGILRKLGMDMFSRDIVEHYENLVRTIVRQREGKPKLRGDFVDLLIEMREQGKVMANKLKSEGRVELEVTETVMTAQLFIFFSAGFETSSTTISLMLLELAKHPDIQDKLYREIREVQSKHGGKITYEALQDMKYLDNVLRETLRKYPVIDQVRRSVRAYRVPGTELTLPAGTHVVVPQLGLNHDPAHFPQPERFDPDRFLRDAGTNWLAMPFGAGPRDCIGE